MGRTCSIPEGNKKSQNIVVQNTPNSLGKFSRWRGG